MEYFGLDDFLLAALKEDVGTGDITTNSCIPEKNRSYGEFVAKSEGVVCGLDVARRVFELVDPLIEFTELMQDGDFANKGDIIARVEGPSDRKSVV